MDDLDFEEAFDEIKSLHHSFDENNPITFQILLTSYREKLNDDQVIYINSEITRLIERQRRIKDKIMNKIDNDITRELVVNKINENENYNKQLE